MWRIRGKTDQNAAQRFRGVIFHNASPDSGESQLQGSLSGQVLPRLGIIMSFYLISDSVDQKETLQGL